MGCHTTHSELTAQVLNHMMVPYYYPCGKNELSTYYMPGCVLNAGDTTEDKTDRLQSHGGNIVHGSVLFCPNSHPPSRLALTVATRPHGLRCPEKRTGRGIYTTSPQCFCASFLMICHCMTSYDIMTIYNEELSILPSSPPTVSSETL